MSNILRAAGLPFLCTPVPTLERCYYDSFDWRLYAANLLLFSEKSRDGRVRLRLRELDSGFDLVAIDVTDIPCFAAEMPRGVMRDRLLPVLKGRRLLPLAHLTGRRDEFRVFDAERKTVMRACVERHRVDTGDRQVRLRERVEVTPVRGFTEPLHAVLPLLERYPESQVLEGDLFDEALQILDRHPLDYHARPTLKVERGDTVGAAARAIFLHLLGVIEANEDGVRQELDADFLHDLRVALRRTRTLLREMHHILSAPHFAHYRDEFTWLASITGPVRDLDVQLEASARYADLLEPAQASQHQDIEALRGLLRSQRTAQRRFLLEGLASSRYRSLKKGWRALLEAQERWTGAECDEPAVEAALAMMRHRHARVMERGEKLDAQSADKNFHAMRKQVKRLRYLIELFDGALAAHRAHGVLTNLKALQKVLGEHQDFAVHIAVLEQIQESCATQDRPSPAVRVIAPLLDQLRERRRAVAEDFASVFSRFAKDEKARKKLFRVPSDADHQESAQ
ncbi:MAG: CHAD domain-containing protein [Chromatiales bacterium]|nr:CHAD domain-containing protein [Chromatiales bacterium]